MNNVNLVVMGKTGAGKSTLINAVLEEDLAPTGTGQAVTKKNQLYTKKMLLPLDSKADLTEQYGLIGKTLNLYDTVGLEIDSSITQATLREIKGFIEKAQQQERENDLSMVWFCVNSRTSRFEQFEIDLIRSLSIDHEIPFLIVLTQCYSEKQGDLEKQIRSDFPEIPVVRVLAKEYKLRNGVIPANGITELLQKSILDYDKSKVHILESKLKLLSADRNKRIDKLKADGKACVDSYANKARKIGYVPGGCIPVVHGMCISMIAALNKIVGINSSKGFSTEIFASALTGIVATPFMGVPFLSSAVAYGYVAAVGESYLDSLMSVISRSTDVELINNDLMAERIKEELKKGENKEMSLMDEYKDAHSNAETEAKSDMPPANIMVAGITGTGKSTLLNAVFGADVAETGKGRPVTDHIDEYKSDSVPIHIWDTVGLELDSAKTKESIDSIKEIIASKADSEDHFDHVHAIWYCINSGSNRYQGAELEFIKSLHSIGVPFIIVLTQCIGDPEEINRFEAQIREINNSMGMTDIDIVQVCAQEYKLRGFTIEAFGLDNLVQTTINKVPDFIKGSFIAAQNVSKAQKREYCGEIIVKYVDAAIEGFWDKVPIVNFFTTDNKIPKMFFEIGKLYNSIIPEDRIQEVIDFMGSMDLEHGILGIILPVSKKFDRKVDEFFDTKAKQGFVVPKNKLEHNERVARMLVYYGYLFLEAVEELWEKRNESMLKSIDEKVRYLKVVLEEKFNKK